MNQMTFSVNPSKESISPVVSILFLRNEKCCEKYPKRNVPSKNRVSFCVDNQFILAHKQLEILSSLEENWDGYGSKPMSEAAVNTAEELLTRLPYAPMIYPVSGGGIQFEYEINDKYLEFEILDDGKIKLFSSNSGEETERIIQLREARGWVNGFYFS